MESENTASRANYRKITRQRRRYRKTPKYKEYYARVKSAEPKPCSKCRTPTAIRYAGCVENAGSKYITRDQDSKNSRKFGLNDMVRNKRKRGDGRAFENVSDAMSLLKSANVECARVATTIM